MLLALKFQSAAWGNNPKSAGVRECEVGKSPPYAGNAATMKSKSSLPALARFALETKEVRKRGGEKKRRRKKGLD